MRPTLALSLELELSDPWSAQLTPEELYEIALDVAPHHCQVVNRHRARRALAQALAQPALDLLREQNSKWFEEHPLREAMSTRTLEALNGLSKIAVLAIRANELRATLMKATDSPPAASHVARGL